MSWAAHELEAYVIVKHVKRPVSFLAVLIGSLSPDMLTKLPVYGVSIGPIDFEADDPAMYHRGWPGVGPTHSLLFGVLIALAALYLTRSRPWALGLLLGQWAHALSDTLDSAGTMLFFPFTTQNYSAGMWAYAAGEGRYGDAAAYYSSLGGLWDLFWVAVVLLSISVASTQWFRARIRPEDPVWDHMQRGLRLSNPVLVAVYRAYLVYGTCRVLAWGFWARFLNPDRGHQEVDLSWGGPHWVEAVSLPARSTGQLIASTAWGLTMTIVAGFLIWRLLGRALWARASDPVLVRA